MSLFELGSLVMLNSQPLSAPISGKEIVVTSCTLDDLFNAHKRNLPGTTIFGKLVIPEYQRPYLWSTKEVSRLVDDLFEHFQSSKFDKPQYYLGSIILHLQDDKLNIIDGQQRITTLALLQKVAGGVLPIIKYTSPVSIQNIKNNFELISSNDLKFKIADIDTNQLNVTLVITSNEDDAYTFFETQNTGGVRLTGVDIIKAHHLREIPIKGGLQNRFAQNWENQVSLSIVVEHLMKARRWGVLNWESVPSERDPKGTKSAIIIDFSEKTLSSKEKIGYQIVQFQDNYSKIVWQESPLSIRQPISNGENFIDYLTTFSELYKRLFLNDDDAHISDAYYQFYKEVIRPIDGTAFLKDFFEISILCYINRFGSNELLEAALWIFRYAYSVRVIKPKMVVEKSVPAFMRDGNYLLDIILTAHSHQELIKKLMAFNYIVNPENLDKNSVKSRFVARVAQFFLFDAGCDPRKQFDDQLVSNIKKMVYAG